MISPHHAAHEQARRKHLNFITATWQRTDPFIIGKHTREICQEIDTAIANYRRGQSTFLIMEVPFRHGKSDIVSRYLPPHFLGMLPDREVLLASYGADLSEEFSKFGRRIMRSPEYAAIYPVVKLADDEQRMDMWGIHRNTGRAQFVGLGGAVTGKGGDLIIVDDFCKSREQAESITYRDKIWDAFTNDIMTRRAPVCIVIILATPWHVDDIFGRIKQKMDADKNFPRFNVLKYPAKCNTYPSGYLFPERFSAQWYDEQFATLGSYGASALLQCDPRVRGGNIFKVDKAKMVNADKWYAQCGGLRYTRGWDLASSEKERISDNPDYTVGVKVAVTYMRSGVTGARIPVLFIDDIKRGRWEAGRRNEIIRETCMMDGDSITMGIEAFAAYKDAYTQIRDALQGLRSVVKVNLPGDKVAKAACLEPIFEAGNVYMKAAEWNDDLLKELADFPNGSHDDIVDALVVAYKLHQSVITTGHI